MDGCSCLCVHECALLWHLFCHRPRMGSTRPAISGFDAVITTDVHPLGERPVFLGLVVFLPFPSCPTSASYTELIKAFTDEFTDDEGVRLFMRTSPDRDLAAVVSEIHGAPHHRIHLLGRQDGPNYQRMIRGADAFVLATHGEGWGRPAMEGAPTSSHLATPTQAWHVCALPYRACCARALHCSRNGLPTCHDTHVLIALLACTCACSHCMLARAFTAMAMELPVIATNWSGFTEFMTDDTAYLLTVDKLDDVHIRHF